MRLTLVPDAGPAYRTTDWLPDLDQLHLSFAVLGLTSIADPTHRPPAPITFDPPGAPRQFGRRLPLVAR